MLLLSLSIPCLHCHNGSVLKCWQKISVRKGNFVTWPQSIVRHWAKLTPVHSRTSGPRDHSQTARLQELSDTLCTRRWLSQWGVWLSAQSHLQVSSTEGTGFPGKLINSGINTDFFLTRCDSCYRILPPSTSDGCDQCGQVHTIYYNISITQV